MQQVFGDVYAWVAGKVEGLPRQAYKGKKLALYIDDDEQVAVLWEDGLAFQTDFPLDEDKLAMRLKRIDTLLEPMRRKMAEEKRKI